MKNMYGAALILFFCVGVSPACHAQTLDDASIRAFYSNEDTAFKDPATFHAFMQNHFADNLEAKLSTTLHIGDTIQQKNETKNKEQIMSATAHSYETMDIKDYSHNVDSIVYSDDKKLAYVKNTGTLSGTLKAAATEGQIKVTTITLQESGTDTLALINGNIEITKSDRQNDLTYGQQ